MARIQITPHPYQKRDTYKSSSMCFTFVSSPASGRRQLFMAVTCRESLCDFIKDDVAYPPQPEGKYWVHLDNEHRLDRTKLRLLLTSNREDVEGYRKKLFNAKAALNLLEEIAGWEKSTILTVDHPCYDNTWLLTGPKEWMSQPQLLSLGMLVFRITTEVGPAKVTTFQDMDDFWKSIEARYGHGDDTRLFLPVCRKYVKLIMTHHKEIFGHIPFEDAYPDVDNFGHKAGINNFVSGQAIYSEVIKEAFTKFSRLIKEGENDKPKQK